MPFHNLCNFSELRAIGADEQKAIFLALFSSSFVKLTACQGEQQLFETGKMLSLCKCFVGASSQAYQPSAFFQDGQLVGELCRTQSMDRL